MYIRAPSVPEGVGAEPTKSLSAGTPRWVSSRATASACRMDASDPSPSPTMRTVPPVWRYRRATAASWLRSSGVNAAEPLRTPTDATSKVALGPVAAVAGREPCRADG